VNRLEAWTLHVAVVLVGGTGLVYAWMLYFLSPVDEFAVVSHSLQPTLQHLHIWFAPFLVFGVGLIWRGHVMKHYRKGMRRRRRSGLSLLVSVAPMAISGYLIQTSVGENWRSVWIAVHLLTSGLFVVGYGIHQLVPWLRRIRRSDQSRRLQDPADSRA